MGNQLFQYSATRTHFPNDKIIFLGYEDLEEVIDGVDACFLEKSVFRRKLFYNFAHRLVTQLARCRLISSVKEHKSNNHYALHEQPGLISNIKLLEDCYFQHFNVLERLSPDISVKAELLDEATQWLSSRLNTIDRASPCFIHVRRGDYLHWPSTEFPAVLNLKWYLRAMDYIYSEVRNPLFVVLTDDVQYANDVFADRDDVVISENSQFIDFALMTLCDHGILSASTFAWWGAWFSKERAHGQGIYLGPRHWAGHRRGEWYPPGFLSPSLIYIE